jgi:hypothetical protein
MYLPQRDGLELEEHIRKYFLNGYSYRTILILKGKFNISLRQLKRIFRRMGLRRRARISLRYLRRIEMLIRMSIALCV